MTTDALWLIRILRRVPHSAEFDCHLTDCAAYAVADRQTNEALPPLTWRHVLRMESLPSPDVRLAFVTGSKQRAGLRIVSDKTDEAR